MVQTVYYCFMDNWLSHFATDGEVHHFSTMFSSCSLATLDKVPAAKPTCHQIICCHKMLLAFLKKLISQLIVLIHKILLLILFL